MSYETILYEVEAGTGTITLNRPEKLNSFNETMHRELIDALKQVERDPGVRCLTITGTGRAFSAGADLQSLGQNKSIGDFVRQTYNVWVTKIRSMEKPVIAAVNGVAAGAGCSLALACDLVAMADKSSFVLAFAKIGLVPDTGASYLLPRLIGYHKAMELALFGDKVTAEQALVLGLCNRVVPESELARTVGEWASRLAKGPRSLGWIKRQLSRGLEQSFEESLELEAFDQEAAAKTIDSREGIAAFLEKREPNFSGK